MQQIWLHNCNEDHDHFNIIMIISCEAHPPCNSSPSLTFAGKRNVMKPQISFRSTELMWKVNLKRAASSKLPVQNQNNFLWTGKCWHTNTDLKDYEWIFVSCKDYIWFVRFGNIWKRQNFTQLNLPKVTISQNALVSLRKLIQETLTICCELK